MAAILLQGKPFVAGGRRSPGAFLRLLHHEPIAKPSPTSPSSPTSDVAVLFFETSCGLSPSAALAAAAKINIKTTANAESVLRLLESYGFTKSNVALIAAKFPALFSYHPEKCIKPKLDLFVSEGFTGGFVAKIFCSDPCILKVSLERKLSPNLHLLMNILGGDRKSVSSAIAGSTRLLVRNPNKHLFPNMETLRKHGVDGANIAKFFKWCPRAITQEPGRFIKSVEFLEDMGFNPSKNLFIHGIKVRNGLNQQAWDRKLQLYRSLGWSLEETLSAFKKNPLCLLISEKKVRKVMAFFIENFKWKPSRLALQPILLSFSLEKRIIPRSVVFNILSTSGLVRTEMKFSTILQLSESDFLKKYLCKYSDTIPELLKVYDVKLDKIVSSNFVH